MSKRTSGLLGWGAFLLACGTTVGGILFAAGSDPYRPPEVRGSMLDIVWAAAFLMLPAVGALVVSRQPRNRLGWLLCAMGLAFGVGLLSGDYAKYGEIVPGADLPARALVAWSSIVFRAAFVAPIFFLLLFPNGEPASPRWRWVLHATLMAFAVGFLAEAFMPGEIEGSGGILNPIGIAALEGPLRALLSIADGATGLLFILAGASPFFRYRQVRGDERQQLRWFAYATLLFVSLMAASVLVESIVPESSDVVGPVVTFIGFSVLAGAFAVAILKHHLYDIDLVVNRTLVYGSLTVTLGAIYLLLILVVQFLAQPALEHSDLTVAASTLAVAALFRPVRSRLQSFIDRRFYRHKYDGVRAIAGFAARQRDEVELDVVRSDVLAVVNATVQPASATLWLSPKDTR